MRGGGGHRKVRMIIIVMLDFVAMMMEIVISMLRDHPCAFV